jgi:hypothetical protein
LTDTLRPFRLLPFWEEMAFMASSLFGISTKPNPLDSPLNLSLMTEAVVTSP